MEARLRELWEQGVSLREIAADPAINVHRDCVAWMADYLGLPKRERLRRGPVYFTDRMPRQIAKWPRDMGTFEDHPRAR